MTPTDYFALSPLLTLFLTALLLLLVDGKKICTVVALVGLATAACFTLSAPASTNPLIAPWISFDALARTFSIIFLAIGIGTVALASSFFQRYEAPRAEFYFLLVSSIFGLILLASALDFLTLFIGLETLSIALYVLCSYMKKWTASHEASFKYFLLGSIATSFLLLGIACIYGSTGSTQFAKMQGSNPLLLTGIALASISLLFKAAVVPFHIWAPDVYAGAPTPVTAFMAIATKAGAFAALIRIFLTSAPIIWHEAIALIAIPTLIYANFVAMKQTELRRFFAYSGISHAGFLLIPLAAAGPDAASSMLFYIVVYVIATFGCFACLAFVDKPAEGPTLDTLKGLFSRSPILASAFSLCLLTLGGIPPTIGFFAKFYLLKVAFQQGYYSLVVAGLLTTILAAFYYLRIVAVMLSSKLDEPYTPFKSYPAAIASCVSVAALIALSFYPQPLLNLLTP